MFNNMQVKYYVFKMVAVRNSIFSTILPAVFFVSRY